MNNKKKGDINIFAASLVAIFVILSIFIMMLINIQPVVFNARMNLVARQAMLKIETDGGITSQTRQKIIESLNFDGFSASNLTIEPTINITNSTKAGYGDEVYLKLTYNYKYNDIQLIGLTGLKKVQETEPLTVKISSTSKNAR